MVAGDDVCKMCHTHNAIYSTMGAIFLCGVAIFSALGIIEDSCMPRVASGIEMRMGTAPMRESVSYAILRVHFYVGDF